MGKLHIAMLSLHSCPLGELGSKDTGGMSVYIREVASVMGKRGHSVDIYTRAHDPLDKQIYHIEENVRLIHLQVGKVEQMDKLILYAYLDDAVCAIENYRKNHGLLYDLIHSHYWLSALVGRRVQTWWKVPHLVSFHTLGAIKNAAHVGVDEPELRIVMEKELVQHSDRILSSTDSEKKELISSYYATPEKIGVIPCGVNFNSFQPIEKNLARQHIGLNSDNIILFVGRIDPLKGIDKLLEAASELDTEKDVQVVVVGGNTDNRTNFEKLLSYSQSLTLQNPVLFKGTLEHEELPFYYSAADVCVIPSFYESFGLVALESLACGTPVVATKVGGIEIIIEPGMNGYVVNNNSSSELARGINDVLSSQDFATATVRDSIRRYSWSNTVDSLLDQYAAALDDYYLIAV